MVSELCEHFGCLMSYMNIFTGRCTLFGLKVYKIFQNVVPSLPSYRKEKDTYWVGSVR
jgi:hypothetical protein